MDDLDAIAQRREALRPWHRDLVVVGGWAHRLYRFHNNAARLPHQPVATRDAERGPRLWLARVAYGRHRCSAEWERPAERRHVLHYSGTSRYNCAAAEASGCPGAVTLDPAAGHSRCSAGGAGRSNALQSRELHCTEALDPEIPKPEKRPQDVLYIHDTLELFGSEIELLKATWRDDIRPTLPAVTARTVERLCQTHFGNVTDVIRNAARIPQDRILMPERLQATCAYGLDEIFGMTKSACLRLRTSPYFEFGASSSMRIMKGSAWVPTFARECVFRPVARRISNHEVVITGQ